MLMVVLIVAIVSYAIGVSVGRNWNELTNEN